jgi:type II secretory pathway component GspD/PulD (secretin)
MVFLRPVIVRSPEDMRAVTRNAYDYTVGAQRQANEGRSSLDDIVDHDDGWRTGL